MARIVLEDNIMQKGKPATAGIKMLENFISPINATVLNRLLDQGHSIVGRAMIKEFGIPNIYSVEKDEIPDAIKAVRDDLADFSLCNDLFGNYREKATTASCCYIHPTYGTVPRLGLIPLATSMDQIGIVCKSIPEGLKLLSQIAGYDENDGAMFPDPSYDYAYKEEPVRIGIPESVVKMADQRTQDTIIGFSGNFPSVKMEIEYFNVIKQVMVILGSAEISNNISRYDGIKFGYRTEDYRGLDDLYIKSRTEGFGLITKLAAVMGSVVLSKDHYASYYEKAMKIRRLIKESLRFDEYDLIVLPTRINDDIYENLSLFALTNLSGLPSVSFDYKGQGLQLIAGCKKEKLFNKVWEVCKA